MRRNRLERLQEAWHLYSCREAYEIAAAWDRLSPEEKEKWSRQESSSDTTATGSVGA